MTINSYFTNFQKFGKRRVCNVVYVLIILLRRIPFLIREVANLHNLDITYTYINVRC